MLLGQSPPMSRLRLGPDQGAGLSFHEKAANLSVSVHKCFFVIFGEGSAGSIPPLSFKDRWYVSV
jgi:hypothetical protein